MLRRVFVEGCTAALKFRRDLARSETGRVSAVVSASQAKAEIGILLSELLCEDDDLAE